MHGVFFERKNECKLWQAIVLVTMINTKWSTRIANTRWPTVSSMQHNSFHFSTLKTNSARKTGKKVANTSWGKLLEIHQMCLAMGNWINPTLRESLSIVQARWTQESALPVLQTTWWIVQTAFFSCFLIVCFCESLIGWKIPSEGECRGKMDGWHNSYTFSWGDLERTILG